MRDVLAARRAIPAPETPAVGKSADAYRTIAEVAADLDLPQHVLRFWETRFPQLRPLKRAGGRRFYRPADLALLRRIRALLHDEGYTIKGVQRLLREGGAKGAAEAPDAAASAAEAGGDGTDVIHRVPAAGGDGDGRDGAGGAARAAAARLATAAPGIPAETLTNPTAGEAGAAALREALAVIEECERRLRAALALGG